MFRQPPANIRAKNTIFETKTRLRSRHALFERVRNRPIIYINRIIQKKARSILQSMLDEPSENIISGLPFVKCKNVCKLFIQKTRRKNYTEIINLELLKIILYRNIKKSCPYETFVFMFFF